MRTLTTTLQTAQQQLLVSPFVKLTRRPMSAWEDRYTLLAGPAGPGFHPAACAGGGLLTLVYQQAGSLKRIQYAGTPPVAGSALTIAADSHPLIACAQAGSTIAVCTVGGTDAVNVYLSTDGGASFPTTESVTLYSGSTDTPAALTCSFNASATKLFIAQQGSTRTSAAVRTAANTYTSVVRLSDGSQTLLSGAPTIGGLASIYTKTAGTGDWLVWLGAYNATTVLSFLAVYTFGDGDQVTAGHWNTGQPVLAVSPPNSTFYQPGSALLPQGVCRTADSLRLCFVQNTRNAGNGLNTNRNYLMTCQSGLNGVQALMRDPQALPVDSSDGLVPAYDASTSRLFLANGATVYYADRPQTVDHSARLLHAVKVESENGTKGSLILDNTDGSLTALATSKDTPGQQLSLDFGYTTSAGAELSATASAPLYVVQATALLHGGRSTLELTFKDSWELLAHWVPRRLYSWLSGESTIQQIIQWILARAGIPFVAPGSPSTLLQTSPAFAIRPGEHGAVTMHALLDMVPEVLWFTSAGATLIVPLAGGSPVYTYADSGHAPLSARLSVSSEAINHVLLLGNALPPLSPAPPPVPTLLAEAFDTDDTTRIHQQAFMVRDMQLPKADAALRAAVPLRKSQMLQDAGEIAAAPNAGLEVWDPISVSFAAMGLASTPFRVRELHTTYDTETQDGVYAQSVGLMNP